MTRTTAAAEGDLLIHLEGEQRNAYRSPRGATPQEGTNVSLWRLPGTWHVWSAGPASGTWWLKAVDEAAAEVAALLERKPARGAPVVTAVWKDCVAVRSRDICARRRAS